MKSHDLTNDKLHELQLAQIQQSSKIDNLQHVCALVLIMCSRLPTIVLVEANHDFDPTNRQDRCAREPGTRWHVSLCGHRY
jgi:hypothetical protein